MTILISNKSDQPIYEQIKDQIKREVLSGNLKNGAELPSIRKLAQELQVSVITTKRAYDDLEQEGFIESVGGKGTFISDQKEEFLKEKKMSKIEEILSEAVHLAKEYKVNENDLIEILKILYTEE